MKSIVGNILDIQRGILVQGCNCHGVMGAGLAKAIRTRYPSVYAAYHELYAARGLKLGTAQICASQLLRNERWAVRHVDDFCSDMPSELVIVNAMTQFDYGTDKRQVDYDAVRSAFARIRLIALESSLPVYVPMIGCGLAGGQWSEVEPRIEAALGKSVDVTLVTFPG